jgi:hypothetical protein
LLGSVLARCARILKRVPWSAEVSLPPVVFLAILSYGG